MHFAELLLNCAGRWVLLCCGITQPVWGWVHWSARGLLIVIWAVLCIRYLRYLVSVFIPGPIVKEGIPDDVLDGKGGGLLEVMHEKGIGDASLFTITVSGGMGSLRYSDSCAVGHVVESWFLRHMMPGN